MSKNVGILNDIESGIEEATREINNAYSTSWDDDVHESFGVFFDGAVKIKADLSILKNELIAIYNNFEKMNLEQLKTEILDFLSSIKDI